MKEDLNIFDLESAVSFFGIRPRGELRHPAPEPPIGRGLSRLLGGDRPRQGHRDGPEGRPGEVRLRHPKGRREAAAGPSVEGDGRRTSSQGCSRSKSPRKRSSQTSTASSSSSRRSTTGPSRRWRSSSPSRRGSSRSSTTSVSLRAHSPWRDGSRRSASQSVKETLGHNSPSTQVVRDRHPRNTTQAPTLLENPKRLKFFESFIRFYADPRLPTRSTPA